MQVSVAARAESLAWPNDAVVGLGGGAVVEFISPSACLLLDEHAATGRQRPRLLLLRLGDRISAPVVDGFELVLAARHSCDDGEVLRLCGRPSAPVFLSVIGAGTRVICNETSYESSALTDLQLSILISMVLDRYFTVADYAALTGAIPDPALDRRSAAQAVRRLDAVLSQWGAAGLIETSRGRGEWRMPAADSDIALVVDAYERLVRDRTDRAYHALRALLLLVAPDYDLTIADRARLDVLLTARARDRMDDARHGVAQALLFDGALVRGRPVAMPTIVDLAGCFRHPDILVAITAAASVVS